MKFSVIFVFLCTTWICTANQTVVSPVPVDIVNTTEEPTTEPVTLELLVEQDADAKAASLTEDDLLEELARQLEEVNEIEPEIRPTKKPKRPQSQNKHPAPHHHHPQHFGPLADPLPYYPAPMPYSMQYPQYPQYPPCPYSQPQPSYYPVPMYSPYPFPAYNPNQFNEQNSPPSVLKATDPADTTEVINVAELLRIANFWNNNVAKNITKNNSTQATKPAKHFFIRNWIRNKANRKANKAALTTTTPAPIPIPNPGP